MNTLIEKLELQARENPKETILFDETVTKGITYEDLHELSGKVYAWLKYQGIGREDFILINLVRGVLPVVAIIGILKAGAAFALVEENYAPERIEYIRKDCGCKSEINRNAWEEILKCEPLDGHEQTVSPSRKNGQEKCEKSRMKQTGANESKVKRQKLHTAAFQNRRAISIQSKSEDELCCRKLQYKQRYRSVPPAWSGSGADEPAHISDS